MILTLVFAAGFGGIVAVWCLRLLARGNIELLLGLVFLSLLFSGYRDTRIDSLFQIFRFFLVGVVAVGGLAHVRRTGTAMRLLFVMSLWLLALTPRAPSLIGGLLFAAALLMTTGPFASGVAGVTSSLASLTSLLNRLLYIAPLYVVLATLGLGNRLAGRRYSGSTTQPQLFAITGGLLVPLLLWGFFYGSRRMRAISGVTLAGVGLFTLLSAQRAGAVALVVGALPFFAIGPLRRYGRSLALFGAGIGGVSLLKGAAAFQYSFARLSTLNNADRAERWQEGFRKVVADPWLAHGPGSIHDVGFGLHNSFLAVAYEGGVIAFALWTAAFVVLLFRVVSLARSRAARESGMACLLIGWALGVTAVACVEVKAYSPSNLMMFVIVIVATASRRGALARLVPARENAVAATDDPAPALGRG